MNQQELEHNLTKNCKDILTTYYKINENNKVLIVYDNQTNLNKLMQNSFKTAIKELNNEQFELDFDNIEPEEIVEFIDNNLQKEDIVILLQSASFRVSKYRWRNELCDRGLKVIEFNQLRKMKENEYETFVNSLTCDFEHQEKIANFLVEKISKSKNIKFICENGSICEYKGEMDKCLKNVGELWNQTNWASKFPIGEVISEGKDLSILNGELEIYAYPDLKTQETIFCEPFTAKIENGFMISHTGNKEFNELFELIKTENEEGLVYVRELGLGLNRFIPRLNRLGDSISYERQEGLHFSLGMKHGMYQKKLWPKYGKKFYQRYHIDVYINIKEILIDNLSVYTNKKGFFIEN